MASCASDPDAIRGVTPTMPSTTSRAIARLALVVAWLWAGTAAAAAPVPEVEVNDAFRRADVAHALSLHEDPGAQETFDQVRADAAFAPADKRGINFGFSHSAWWARLDIRNDSDRDREVMLRQDYPLIDHIDLWAQDAGGHWQVVRTGDRLPFASRPLAHRDFVFPLRVPKHQVTRIYLRFETAGAMNIGLTLSSPHALIEELSFEQLAYGAYFGGFFVLFFYNLFIFVTVRDRAFFYYLMYAASYGLYFGVHDGLSFQFLWPNSPVWANQSLLVLLCLTLWAGLMFTRQFLNSALHSPRLDRAAAVLQWLTVLGLAASFAFSYEQVIQPLAYLSVASPLLMMAMGGVGLAQGYRPARFFMLAWVALLLGVLVYMFKTFGLLPHNGFTQNGFQVGALLEMVLLSLALAARVNELQRQSLTDALTSLSNRRYFDRHLELAFAHARTTGVSLLVVDIDHFKVINDRHGHARGDDILVEVARVLSKRVPPTATVCRFGGEEFTILLPGTAEFGTAAAEALRAAVEAYFTGDLKVTVSIGVAHTPSRTYRDEMEFFKSADEALYRAKQGGRNRVEIAA